MVRCPACGNENPPEYPPDEYPFCIECGAQLGTFRPAQPPPASSADPYARGPADPYAGGPPPGPYQPQPDPYADPRHDPYQHGRTGSPDLPTPAAAARLILESGLGKIEYPLDAPVVTIGRSRSNDISLDDARVSRHHARIVRDATGYLIEDLNSRNGTRVDERAVRDSAVLTEGAMVRIGDSVFRFTVGAPAGQPARPAPGPSPFGGPSAGSGHGANPGRQVVQEIFLAPWQTVQCPSCQGRNTMRQIVYGPAAQSPGAILAAQRGEIALGDGPPRQGAPNAECRACGIRVRIVSTGG